MFTFDYDGPSLPMIRIKETGEVYRIQRLESGKWESLISEDEYWQFIQGLQSK